MQSKTRNCNPARPLTGALWARNPERVSKESPGGGVAKRESIATVSQQTSPPGFAPRPRMHVHPACPSTRLPACPPPAHPPPRTALFHEASREQTHPNLYTLVRRGPTRSGWCTFWVGSLIFLSLLFLEKARKTHPKKQGFSLC